MTSRCGEIGCGIVKRHVGFTKVCYKGLAQNAAQVFPLVGFNYLYLLRHALDGLMLAIRQLCLEAGPPHSECIFPDRIATWK